MTTHNASWDTDLAVGQDATPRNTADFSSFRRVRRGSTKSVDNLQKSVGAAAGLVRRVATDPALSLDVVGAGFGGVTRKGGDIRGSTTFDAEFRGLTSLLRSPSDIQPKRRFSIGGRAGQQEQADTGHGYRWPSREQLLRRSSADIDVSSTDSEDRSASPMGKSPSGGDFYQPLLQTNYCAAIRQGCYSSSSLESAVFKKKMDSGRRHAGGGGRTSEPTILSIINTSMEEKLRIHPFSPSAGGGGGVGMRKNRHSAPDLTKMAASATKGRVHTNVSAHPGAKESSALPAGKSKIKSSIIATNSRDHLTQVSVLPSMRMSEECAVGYTKPHFELCPSEVSVNCLQSKNLRELLGKSREIVSEERTGRSSDNIQHTIEPLPRDVEGGYGQKTMETSLIMKPADVATSKNVSCDEEEDKLNLRNNEAVIIAPKDDDDSDTFDDFGWKKKSEREMEEVDNFRWKEVEGGPEMVDAFGRKEEVKKELEKAEGALKKERRRAAANFDDMGWKKRSKNQTIFFPFQ